MIIALCAAGLPAKKVQAAENTGLTVSDGELERPVITKLKNGIKNVIISWSRIDGADYYCIYRLDKHLSTNTLVKDWEKIGETEDNNYLDPNLGYTSGLSYEYKVRAVKIDSDGREILSPVSASKLIHRLSKPRFKVANTKGHIRVQLREAYGCYLGIIVYRKGPGEDSYTRIYKGRAHTIRDTDVVEGETYSYKICTYRGSSKSAVSKVQTIIRTKP